MEMLEEVKRLFENDHAPSFVEGVRVGAILNKETGGCRKPIALQGLFYNSYSFHKPT